MVLLNFINLEEIKKFYFDHREQLASFVFRMVNDPDLTEDILQDTMVTAIEKVSQHKKQASLKTWIFSIASNKTIDHLRKEKRWSENVMDHAKSAAMMDRDIIGELMGITQQQNGQFDATEHIELCFRCISKTLPIEQQLALILKDIFDFKVKEIANVLERSDSQVRHYLEDARSKMIEIYDRRCALINKKGVCHQCTELLGIYNPSEEAQRKLMEVRFVKDAANKDQSELYQLRSDLVKSINPLQSGGHEFQHRHMKFICDVTTQE